MKTLDIITEIEQIFSGKELILEEKENGLEISPLNHETEELIYIETEEEGVVAGYYKEEFQDYKVTIESFNILNSNDTSLVEKVKNYFKVSASPSLLT